MSDNGEDSDIDITFDVKDGEKSSSPEPERQVENSTIHDVFGSDSEDDMCVGVEM